MKKLFALLLAVTMLLSLCACGSSHAPKKPIEEMDDEDWEAAAEALEDMYEEEEPGVETEPAEKIYELGETVVTAEGMFELSIDRFGFTDFYNARSYLPEQNDLPIVEAPEGKTYLLVEGTMRFVGDPKETVQHFISAEELDYNDGYKFSYKVPASMFEPNTSGVLGDQDAYGKTNINFEPLTGTCTKDVRAIFEIPEVIGTDTESPMLLSMVVRTFGLQTKSKDEVTFTVKLR